MTTIVIVEDGQPRAISGEFSAMQMQTVDVWGFPVPAAQLTNFPAGWLAGASPEELATINAFAVEDPQPPEGEEIETQALDVDADGMPFWAVTFREIVPPAPFVPQVVSRMQAKLALAQAGLLDQVEANMATKPKAVQIYWSDVSEIHRDHPILTAAANDLGLTQQQIDQLFISAKQIV